MRVDTDSPGAGPARRPAMNSLTALRFVAAMAIVLFHLKSTMPAFMSRPYFDKFAVGVGFFFVLSGFVLAYGLGGGPFRTREFYTKRLIRVVPLHWVTLGVWCWVYYAGWGVPTPDKQYALAANALLVHALVPGFLYSLGFNAVSWSLSCEVVFYLLFPVLRFPAVARGVVVAVCGAVLYLHLSGRGTALNAWFPGVTYFCPVFRVAEFAVGILMGLAFRSRLDAAAKVGKPAPAADLTWLEVGVLAAFAFQVYGTGVIDGQFAQLVTVFPIAGIIWVFAHERGRVSRFLAGSRTLVFLGEASFSLYMWHHMILFGLGRHLPTDFGTNRATLLGVGLSVVASVVSYTLFENPTRWALTRLLLRKRPTPPAAVEPDVLPLPQRRAA